MVKMENVTNADATLRAFWHKGRRAFIEWTGAEIARRLGDDEGNAGHRLRLLSELGLATGEKLNSRIATGSAWRLTAKGEEMASKLMRGAE